MVIQNVFCNRLLYCHATMSQITRGALCDDLKDNCEKTAIAAKVPMLSAWILYSEFALLHGFKVKQKCLTKGSVVRCTVTRPLWFPFFISLFLWESVRTREPFARKVCYLNASSTINLLFYPPRGLSSNYISKIDNESFAGLKTLHTLWVNHGNILYLGALTDSQTWLTNPQMEYFSSPKLRSGLAGLGPGSQKSRIWSYTIPFISSQRRDSKPSNFAVLFVLKTCWKISFLKQAGCTLTTGFSDPKSSWNFREIEKQARGPALERWLVWLQAALTVRHNWQVSSAELADPTLRFVLTKRV